ncbi:ABC transporter ATP-binding protein [Paraburkholderia phenazinium]|uniref:ABC transporter ATP-binding protein n=1 Tax=Paraburkholderia phenazinium TaxID=60549 RepID=UPI00158E2FCD|nr:ABC transporter ATP-binding protein [Paraburkholderia phenazinium]
MRDSSAASPLLALKSVGYAHAKHRALLDDISLAVRRGERLSLTGPNGCGKSTLLSIVATVLRPSRGQILFEGRDVMKQLKPYRQQMSFTAATAGGFYPRLSAIENIEIFSLLRGNRYSRPAIARLLDEVELARSATNRYFHEFSTGMRQRLQIARAFLEPTALILLDEPTIGLDAAGLAMLDRMIRAREDAAFIIVSHDAEFHARHQTGRYEIRPPAAELREARGIREILEAA